ncbi:MAG: hypothetical protein R3A79_25195 [Nannocystaceae bacterium]
MLALLPACGSNCLDDGFAWSQSKEECAAASATDSDSGTTTGTTTATTTTGVSETGTTTASGSESGTESSGGATQYCKDNDMDGQGDPNDCIPADGDTPPGYVPNGDDCDDGDPNTYKGAAELEDPEACMTDADDDGWGEPNPAPGVTPGTDCDDSNPYAFPGAAELDDPVACMEDEDDDGYGDVDPPPGVEPGTDCVDTDANTYPGAAENESAEACMTDEDGDGYGDDDPPPGSTPGSDCDDSNEFTFPGAAPNDDPDACMKDEDDDDYGDAMPPEGVDPGTDCDDSNEFTYPGAAELEVPPDACMRDVDDDGYGDDNPGNPNVQPGIDCNDTDPLVFEMCADCEPEQLFCMGEELHLCNMNGTGSKLEQVCDFGCDMVNNVCFEELTVDAGPSLCIDQGEMAQLQATAMGGDGSYMWDWTPANSLNDPNIDNPLASPMEATTYTVTVTDGKNDSAQDSVSVFIKDAALVLDDVSCKITNFAWGGDQQGVNWNWNPNEAELCQLANSNATARFCGWSLDNANIQGRFEVKTLSDDDYVGFLWGIQPFDQMVEEPKQFYFFSWKQLAQPLAFCGNDPLTGLAGMQVKRINVDDPMNMPLGCTDMLSASDTANSTLLAAPADFTTQGWLDNVAYIFDLTHTPTGFTVKIIRESNMQTVAEQTFVDDTYPNGQVGFFAYSQQNSCFSQFKTSCL